MNGLRLAFCALLAACASDAGPADSPGPVDCFTASEAECGVTVKPCCQVIGRRFDPARGCTTPYTAMGCSRPDPDSTQTEGDCGGTLTVECYERDGEWMWAPNAWPIAFVERSGWVRCDRETSYLVWNAPDCAD